MTISPGCALVDAILSHQSHLHLQKRKKFKQQRKLSNTVIIKVKKSNQQKFDLKTPQHITDSI